MKKALGIMLTIVWVIICLSTPIMVAAEEGPVVTVVEDPRTGVTYSIEHQTTVSGSVSWRIEDSSHIEQGRPYYKDIYAPLSSSKGQAAMEECNEKLKRQLDWQTGYGIVDERYVLNGFEYKVPKECRYYWRFFELPEDFKGTKVITKDGVPFTVTGDGKGNLSYKIVVDFKGEKRATFIIPPERNYDIQENQTANYSMYYYVKDSAAPNMSQKIGRSQDFETLEEALDDAVANADLEDDINISAEYEYSVTYHGDLTNQVTLEVIYGNTRDHTSEEPTTNKQTTTPEQPKKPSSVPSKSTSSTVTEDAKTAQEEPTDSSTSIEENSPKSSETTSDASTPETSSDVENEDGTISPQEAAAAQPKTQPMAIQEEGVQSPQNEPEKNNAPVIWFTVLGVVAAGGIGAGGYWWFRRKKS